MSFIDYKGPFRSEAFIAEGALKCWKIGTLPESNRVDLITILKELEAHGVESIFRIRGMRLKGRLKIEMVDDDPGEFLAWVEFTPTLKMCVQNGVWARFQEGRPYERIIVAHEIGHIMLHDDNPKQFSRDKSLQITFAENEYSVEWQANTFADHLLIPSHVADRIIDVERLAFTCNVPDQFAYERLAGIWKAKKLLGALPNGKVCPSCGGFSIPDGGTECNTCPSRKWIPSRS